MNFLKFWATNKFKIKSIIKSLRWKEQLKKLSIIKDDLDDNKVLECAKAGKVDFIVSNDKHLLKLKNFEKIKIVSPKEFFIEK